MSDSSPENQLLDRRYATLILRCTLTKEGRLVYGEIVDVTSTHQQHFVGNHGLTDAIQAWLAQQEQDNAPDQPS